MVNAKNITCHGEVAAIRNACYNLDTFDLTGCELYTTGEPCHMCLCACLELFEEYLSLNHEIY